MTEATKRDWQGCIDLIQAKIDEYLGVIQTLTFYRDRAPDAEEDKPTDFDAWMDQGVARVDELDTPLPDSEPKPELAYRIPPPSNNWLGFRKASE